MFHPHILLTFSRALSLRTKVFNRVFFLKEIPTTIYITEISLRKIPLLAQTKDLSKGIHSDEANKVLPRYFYVSVAFHQILTGLTFNITRYSAI